MVYLVGPGAFLPLEQEVSRALANQARDIGTGLDRPSGRRGRLRLRRVPGGGDAHRATADLDHLLDDEVVLLPASCWRSSATPVHPLGGARRDGPVPGVRPLLHGRERDPATACALLAAAGVMAVGAYGLTVGLAPYLALVYALWGEKELTTDGPPAPEGELVRDMASLLAASTLTAFLLYAGPRRRGPRRGRGQRGRRPVLHRGCGGLRPCSCSRPCRPRPAPALGACGAGRFADFRPGWAGSWPSSPGSASWARRALRSGRSRSGCSSVRSSTSDGPTSPCSRPAAFMLAVLGQALIAPRGSGRVAFGWLVGTPRSSWSHALGNDLFLRVEARDADRRRHARAGRLMYQRLHQNLRAHPHDLVPD